MTARAAFRKDDLNKALDAVIGKGLTPRRVRIAADGSIDIDCADTAKETSTIDFVDWKR